MPERDLDQYRAGLANRRARRLAAMETRRLAILALTRQAGRRLAGFGAARVILFGSLLASGRFHEHSDVDMIVYGLPPGKWHAALVLLENWPGLEDVSIDLKRAEELPADFLAFTEKNSEEIFP